MWLALTLAVMRHYNCVMNIVMSSTTVVLIEFVIKEL